MLCVGQVDRLYAAKERPNIASYNTALMMQLHWCCRGGAAEVLVDGIQPAAASAAVVCLHQLSRPQRHACYRVEVEHMQTMGYNNKLPAFPACRAHVIAIGAGKALHTGDATSCSSWADKRGYVRPHPSWIYL